ncbi:hypothetical protein QRX50_43815 [Amycolatopsis carbonis]|uniref:Uncharacterized protein n=1 Tax=Amycolatopsis carbonis TaxID=715471 RepID=A0A9Y2MWQ9_9PSEU|nr:hypothetical protein [Amycolatopsis sp. 2-15]WIX78234.1 hypothetical protein QRX50_43815 [Amycolatopsis sp. 2-15]
MITAFARPGTDTSALARQLQAQIPAAHNVQAVPPDFFRQIFPSGTRGPSCP